MAIRLQMCVVDDVIPFALISLRPYSCQSALVVRLSPARKIQSHCQKRFNITHNVVSTFRPSRKKFTGLRLYYAGVGGIPDPVSDWAA
jgi:hypothetical protein